MDSSSTVEPAGLPPTAEPMWRLGHLGRHLGRALQRFDARVLDLMTADVDAPLALSNLAARRQIGAAHIHVMRHLPLAGERLTVLAQRADMSKQAMGDLLDQCVAWGLVERKADPHDRRARRVVFTHLGRQWLDAFGRAVAQAEQEFRALVGQDVATVVVLGLEAYAEGE
ncbi:MAG: helix-turn-helix domain-containing protein [Burkholderiaceae bacterium]|nr:helix-turn-helix domain-containing protein [Burkholderiaceae bacterium]